MSYQPIHPQYEGGANRGLQSLKDTLFAAAAAQRARQQDQYRMLAGDREAAQTDRTLDQRDSAFKQQQTYQDAQIQNMKDLRAGDEREEERRVHALHGKAMQDALGALDAGDVQGFRATLAGAGLSAEEIEQAQQELAPPPQQQPQMPPQRTEASDIDEIGQMLRQQGSPMGQAHQQIAQMGAGMSQTMQQAGMQAPPPMPPPAQMMPQQQGPTAAPPAEQPALAKAEPQPQKGSVRYRIMDAAGKELMQLDPEGRRKQMAETTRTQQGGYADEAQANFTKGSVFSKYLPDLFAGIRGGDIKHGDELKWLQTAKAADDANAARETAARQPRGGAGNPLAKPRFDADLRVKIEGGMEKVLKTFGYKAIANEQNVLAELQTLNRGATVSPGMATLIRGRFAKFAQGAGVLTDQDLAVFYRDMGGIAAKFQQSVEDLMSGTLTDDKMRMIDAALGALQSRANKKQGAFGPKLQEYLTSWGEPGLSLMPTFLNIYAPGYKAKGAAGGAALDPAALKAVGL